MVHRRSTGCQQAVCLPLANNIAVQGGVGGHPGMGGRVEQGQGQQRLSLLVLGLRVRLCGLSQRPMLLHWLNRTSNGCLVVAGQLCIGLSVVNLIFSLHKMYGMTYLQLQLVENQHISFLNLNLLVSNSPCLTPAAAHHIFHLLESTTETNWQGCYHQLRMSSPVISRHLDWEANVTNTGQRAFPSTQKVHAVALPVKSCILPLLVALC